MVESQSPLSIVHVFRLPITADLTCSSQTTLLGTNPAIYLGGKGVGSQGDGTAQLLVKDEATAIKLLKLLNLNFRCSA
jgi:hypothetical protein